MEPDVYSLNMDLLSFRNQSSSSLYNNSNGSSNNGLTMPPLPDSAANPSLEEQRLKLQLARETVRLRELELQLDLEQRKQRVRELDLQIAAEKRKEREAEVELARLQAMHVSPSVPESASNPALQNGDTPNSTTVNTGLQNMTPFTPMIDFNFMQMSNPALASTGMDNFPGMGMFGDSGFATWTGMPTGPTMAPFSGLDMSNGVGGPVASPTTMDPGFEDMLKEIFGGPEHAIPPEPPLSLSSGSPDDPAAIGADDADDHADDALVQGPSTTASGSSGSSASPLTQAPLAPSARRSRKLRIETLITCSNCGNPIAKLLLRGTREELDVPYELRYLCEDCTTPVTFGEQPQIKRRIKQGNDTTMPTVCDVCLRRQGTGGIVPKFPEQTLEFASEVVCLQCTEKYQRCSDCGGGSGRAGAGKWRCKELFDEGRKTCNLSHARLGTGDLEMASWDVSDTFRQDVMIDSVIEACEVLWKDNFLRLAVPEVLEVDSDSPLQLKTFQDIENKILASGWPAKDFVLKGPGPGQRHYVSLTWARNRPRRGKPVIEELPEEVNEEDKLLANLRRTTKLYPPGYMLVNIWLSQWDISSRTIRLFTTSPFENSDLDAHSSIAIAEMFRKIIAAGTDDYASANRPPLHVWMTFEKLGPMIDQRVEDAFVKKRAFLPLEAYIQRHADMDQDQFRWPAYTRAALDPQYRQSGESPVLVLVKHLGSSMSWQKLLQLKIQEMKDRKEASQLIRKRKATDEVEARRT
ncbi:hypothetical protein DACRYDRAFT_23548 [Dacryopinax primogenitus]|uniref:Uncharacterized protein n=1 Tax=Dacryopinax primogenitus (strain DJM 731) TaxID=1858805 RepID=M5FUR1_DACPD|nr:uncharacterized protein DACRYDRAFT_23548 [Dacryopinax primogenitus]EJT99993.1 hypothetical protein DACRYDRAFT_23548 [Dacryopinax primogenitus]